MFSPGPDSAATSRIDRRAILGFNPTRTVPTPSGRSLGIPASHRGASNIGFLLQIQPIMSTNPGWAIARTRTATAPRTTFSLQGKAGNRSASKHGEIAQGPFMRISIIIPTRERARYLQHSLATATAIIDAKVEILVSDNASTDDTRAVVAANTDPRVRYVNTGARLSMRQNFEFALGQSTGDYVIFFGDDDGILPGQFPVLRRILETQKPDALSWDFPVFGWPVPGYGVKTGGLRFLRKSTFGAPYHLDRDARLRAVEQGLMNAMYPMPGIYHGCMSRAYLDQLACADGTYFGARSPDVYMNFRALQHGGKLVHLHHPLSINGYSPASTGGSMRAQGQQGTGTDQTKPAASSFIAELAVDPVDDVVPISKSMTIGFLGTLETVRHLFPDEPVTPDYQSWYHHALSELGRKDPATAANILASLDAHAMQFNAQDALARAKAQGAEPRLSRLHRAWDRARNKIGSFRLSAEIDGQNTILTAARMCDTVLGTDQMAILDTTTTRSAAWQAARKRSKQFSRQI